MRHLVKKKILSRVKEQREALERHLLSALFEHGKIRTSFAKAKLIQGSTDRLINKAKEKTLASKRYLLKKLPPAAVRKIEKELLPRYQSQKSGFTKITKLPQRKGDAGVEAIIELIK